MGYLPKRCVPAASLLAAVVFLTAAGAQSGEAARPAGARNPARCRVQRFAGTMGR